MTRPVKEEKKKKQQTSWVTVFPSNNQQSHQASVQNEPEPNWISILRKGSSQILRALSARRLVGTFVQTSDTAAAQVCRPAGSDERGSNQLEIPVLCNHSIEHCPYAAGILPYRPRVESSHAAALPVLQAPLTRNRDRTAECRICFSDS